MQPGVGCGGVHVTSCEVPDPPLVSVFSAPYAVKRGAWYAYLEAPDAEVAMLV